MISVPVRDMSGAECGSYQFDPDMLAEAINRQLLHDVVVMYNANRRLGSVQTKSRGMVAGSTRKLFKQKGTGRARAGSRAGFAPARSRPRRAPSSRPPAATR